MATLTSTSKVSCRTFSAQPRIKNSIEPGFASGVEIYIWPARGTLAYLKKMEPIDFSNESPIWPGKGRKVGRSLTFAFHTAVHAPVDYFNTPQMRAYHIPPEEEFRTNVMGTAMCTRGPFNHIHIQHIDEGIEERTCIRFDQPFWKLLIEINPEGSVINALEYLFTPKKEVNVLVESKETCSSLLEEEFIPDNSPRNTSNVHSYQGDKHGYFW